MPPTRPAATAARSLAEVMSQLAGQDAVDGIVVFGSAATGAIGPDGDYDLFLVLADDGPPLRLVVTVVDGRLAEFLCATAAEVDRLATGEPASATANWDDAALARFLLGRIAFDRHGRLRRARERLRERPVPEPFDDRDLSDRWFRTGYNLLQTRRLLVANDAASQTTVDLRLLYMVYDAWLDYFRARRVPWRGDKEAARHLEAHDPDFLDLLRRCLAESDRARKLDLCSRLADLAFAPLGGVWPAGATALQLGAGGVASDEATTAALAAWDALVDVAPDGEPRRFGPAEGFVEPTGSP